MGRLLKCPFCGGEAKLNYFGDESHIPFYQVSCSECGCKQVNSIHKESVINAWNTRKPMDNIVEKLEEKTEFLKDCTKYGNESAERQEKSYSTMMMYEVADLVDDLIDIVKQESEQIDKKF